MSLHYIILSVCAPVNDLQLIVFYWEVLFLFLIAVLLPVTNACCGLGASEPVLRAGASFTVTALLHRNSVPVLQRYLYCFGAWLF